MAGSFLANALGVDPRMFQGVGASMAATELGALAQVAALFLQYGGNTHADTGRALMAYLAKRVRSEVLLIDGQETLDLHTKKEGA